MVGPDELELAGVLRVKLVAEIDDTVRLHLAPNANLRGEEKRLGSAPSGDAVGQRGSERIVGACIGGEQSIESDTVVLGTGNDRGRSGEKLNGRSVEV